MNAAGSWLLYAKVLLWLAENIKIPEAPWFILGEPTAEELAVFLEGSPYSQTMLDEGILFVAQVHQHSTAFGYVHALTIEGIGNTPEEATLNFLVGADQNEMRSLTLEADHFFSEVFPEASLFEYTRVPSRDVGFFIKRAPNGKFYLKKEWEAIDMERLRQTAAIKYASLSYLSNRVYRDEISRLLSNQIGYAKMLDRFQDRFQRARRAARLSEALHLREQAIRNLESAQRDYERAAKWARVAQGITFLTGLLSLGGAAYGYFTPIVGGEKLSAATRQENDALITREYKATEVWEQNNRTHEFSLEVREIIREVLPNAPLPPEPLPQRLESLDWLPSL